MADENCTSNSSVTDDQVSQPRRYSRMMEFTTARQDYSVAEFYDNFGHSLPKIVAISQGFCGEIVEDTFDRDQVSPLCLLTVFIT